jgi:hypothetical protein
MSIACGHCKGRHDSVTEVRHCSLIDPANTKPVSSWSLRSSGESPAHAAAVHASRTGYVSPQEANERLVASYGDVVNRQNGHVPNHAADAPARTKTRAAEGMYRKAGTIYKVQKAVHGSRQNYAKRLVETLVIDKKTGKPKWKFEYAPGFVYELRPEHALTVEQAKEFGCLYGSCAICGRTLTNEISIEMGIGPVCREKYFE